MDLEALESVIEQYLRHGWKLRRALLSRPSITAYSALLESAADGLITRESDTEALWFSRRSQPDREAWELRRLSDSPFALVAVLDDTLSEDEREDILRSVEQRMFDGSHPEPTSH